MIIPNARNILSQFAVATNDKHFTNGPLILRMNMI